MRNIILGPLQHVPCPRSRFGPASPPRRKASCSTVANKFCAHASLIEAYAVRSRAMPPGNISEMTNERAFAAPADGSPPARRRSETVRINHEMAKVTAHAIRGRLLSFVRAPRGAGDAESYRYIDDGMIVVEDGRIARVGPAAELGHDLTGGNAGRASCRRLDHAGLHRPAYPFSADPGDRLLRRPTAGMAGEIHLRRGAEIRRSAPTPRAMPNFSSTNWRATAPPRRLLIAPRIRYHYASVCLTFSSVSLATPPKRVILQIKMARRREGYTAVELSR